MTDDTPAVADGDPELDPADAGAGHLIPADVAELLDELVASQGGSDS
jgi:hypothetical protein